jgi:hypothetical protein
MTVMRDFVNSPSNFVAYDYACAGMNVAPHRYQPATKDIKKFTHWVTGENVVFEPSSSAVAALVAFHTPVADFTVCFAKLWKRREKCDLRETPHSSAIPEILAILAASSSCQPVTTISRNCRKVVEATIRADIGCSSSQRQP